MTDREAATFATEKAIDCLAVVDRHHKRLLMLEAQIRDLNSIIDELTAFIISKYPE